jgi:hypothetical protein
LTFKHQEYAVPVYYLLTIKRQSYCSDGRLFRFCCVRTGKMTEGDHQRPLVSGFRPG